MASQLMRAIILINLIGGSDYALSRDSGKLRYEKRTTFSPNDYLFKSHDDKRDAVFDRYVSVDLGVNLGIGSDCGRVNFKNTLRSSLNNMLNARYFGSLGRNILSASPMLATCYFSPTWCAILKHSQLSANFMSQMRLDQCALIDKYTDSRVDDFYAERQTCVHKQIEQNGGDLEAAMESCRNVWQADLSDWAGRNGKVATNKLIESSAAWAGYHGAAANRAIDLAKAFVGDSIVSRGNVSVEYGSRASPLTPQGHLQALRNGIHAKLCQNLVLRVVSERGRRGVSQTVSDRDLKDVSTGSEEVLVDRQTIEALAYMPELQREHACQKLTDAIAMTTLTKDMNRSLDILTVSTQNPHLPPHRKAELVEKRKTFKESIELTLELQRQRSEPLNRVLSEINTEGLKYRGLMSDRVLSSGAASHDHGSMKSVIFDCADGVLCDRR